jgi:hypothetical protein
LISERASVGVVNIFKCTPTNEKRQNFINGEIRLHHFFDGNKDILEA